MERTVEVVARLGDTILDVAHRELGSSYRLGTSIVRVGLVEPEITIGLVTITMTLVPRATASVPRARLDGRPFGYLLAALIAHVALWAIAVSTHEPEPHLAERTEMRRQAYVAAIAKAPPPPVPKKPRTAKPTARPPASAPPIVAETEPATPRGKAIARARRAGVLGGSGLGDLSKLMPPENLAALVDEAGPLYDELEANRGNFGNSLKVCQEGCDSIPVGDYATVSTGRGAGDLYDLGGPPAGKPPLVAFCRPDGCSIDDPREVRSIRSRVEQRRAAFVACYEKYVAPGTSGTVTLSFSLDEEAKIVRLKGRGLGDVARCMAGVVKTIHFRDSAAGTRVTYPISFEPR